MLIHVGAPLAPHDLPGAWTLDPLLLATLAVPAALYGKGARAMPAFTRRRQRWFWGGMAALVVALVSPLDQLGDTLFSAHMVQHLVLIGVAAPLLALAEPLAPMLRALPRGGRRAAARMGRRGEPLRRLLRLLVTPGVALLAHLAALWAWHLPGPYESALRHQGVHAAEHLSFMVTALAFWWAVLRPLRGAGGEAAAVALAFVAIVQCGVLGALITFASHPWYAAHGPGARAWGLTLLEDQQLAGLLMWVPAGIPYLWVALVVLGRRLQRGDRPLAHA
ncbi:MAG TPA: cytochrome c oxidase assembly protein [Gemmatimonadaceae bacterium]